MPLTSTRTIQLQWEALGAQSGRPLLLIEGLGCQLIHWPKRFCDRLIEAGHRVIVFDNRDIGLSTWLTDAGIPNLEALLVNGENSGGPNVPYGLGDMADDVVGLLDELGLDSAHLCGTSMGGMIAQTLALQHPDRVRSLTSIMSTPGTRDLPLPHPDATARLMMDASRSLEGSVEDAVENARVFGSPCFDEAWVRSIAARSHRRSFHPAGNGRQLAAVITQSDRAKALARLRTPATVIHGSLDPLVPPSHGLATAKAIPGARWLLIDGMGHDLAPRFHVPIVEAVTELTLRCERET